MLTGKALEDAFLQLPAYCPEIVDKNASQRMLELNNIYDIYVPSTMSKEIYTKLYTALFRSLQRKETKEAVIQANNIFRASSANAVKSASVIGGSDCMTIIGDSGIGKSRTIAESIKLIVGDNFIEINDPFRKIIPCITVQTPYDSSVKSLLLEILKETDKHLSTNFYEHAIQSKTTTDILIMTVSQIALEHIGMIVVDEIQNTINSRQGRNLVGCLTQLINNSQIAIVMVGIPSCIDFFESEMFLARRAIGLRYKALPFADEFIELCRVLFTYRYVKKQPVCTEELCYWLWNKTQGNISALIGMVAGAQEIAILNGFEELDKNTLQMAYDDRLAAMKIFLRPRKKQYQRMRGKKQIIQEEPNNYPDAFDLTYAEIVREAKCKGEDPLRLLSEAGLIERIVL